MGSAEKAEDPDRADADARHRLANAFQLLATLARMRSQRSESPEARRQLGWLLEAMAALGAVQQRLWNGGVELAGYLEEMTPAWRKRCHGRPVTVALETEPVRVSGQAASALALIANELVINALTHAFADGRPGEVRIVLRKLPDGEAELSVADEGDGYDPEAVGGPGKLGLWLVKGLAGQMKAKLVTTRQGGCMTRVVFVAEPD